MWVWAIGVEHSAVGLRLRLRLRLRLGLGPAAPWARGIPLLPDPLTKFEVLWIGITEVDVEEEIDDSLHAEYHASCGSPAFW